MMVSVFLVVQVFYCEIERMLKKISMRISVIYFPISLRL